MRCALKYGLYTWCHSTEENWCSLSCQRQLQIAPRRQVGFLSYLNLCRQTIKWKKKSPLVRYKQTLEKKLLKHKVLACILGNVHPGRFLYVLSRCFTTTLQNVNYYSHLSGDKAEAQEARHLTSLSQRTVKAGSELSCDRPLGSGFLMYLLAADYIFLGIKVLCAFCL